MTAREVSIHLLDLGTEKFGDAVLIQAGPRTVLVDGGHVSDFAERGSHPSLPAQLQGILGQALPLTIDLVVISHAHDDHVGCLPELIAQDVIAPRWAYVPSVEMAWPADVDQSLAGLPPNGVAAIAGLREEELSDADPQLANAQLEQQADLLPRYRSMLTKLEGQARVVYHGAPTEALVEEMAEIQLQVLGPTRQQIELAHTRLTKIQRKQVTRLREILASPAAHAWDALSLYTAVNGPTERHDALLHEVDVAAEGDEVKRAGAAVNLQSAVITIGTPQGPAFFGGDMQFHQPGVGGAEMKQLTDELWSAVIAAGPLGFAKLSHHGSVNSNPPGFTRDLGCKTFGICTGVGGHDHPAKAVLDELVGAEGVSWIRTDTNGCAVARIDADGVDLSVSTGSLNDAGPT